MKASAHGAAHRPTLTCDRQDRELVDLVNEFIETGQNRQPERLKKLFDPFLHPRGIKELAASRQRRMAYAVVRLLGTLEHGRAEDRVEALRLLRDEVLHAPAGHLRLNTARVLVEIMKALVRHHGDQAAQVRLAHDFFAAMSGRALVIRRELRRYHLLELPESGNQVAMDFHVHDANTKGRKAPTHLILDAWIKGIRQLQVIYYNHIPQAAAEELTAAAEILGLSVRAGVELPCRFRDKYVQLVWAPRGFNDRQDFLGFLSSRVVQEFFAEGREVSDRHSRYVLGVLDGFNRRHREALASEYGIDLPPLERERFLEFVGTGQPSIVHLADYLHHLCLPHLRRRLAEIHGRLAAATGAEREALEARLRGLGELLPERIIERCLRAEHHPELGDPKRPDDGDPHLPRLLRLGPAEMVTRLRTLRSGFRLTLNPSNLTAPEVLEVLYACRGAVTHLEIFNLKDFRQGRTLHRPTIARLRRVINAGNPFTLKRLVHGMIADLEGSDLPDREERIHRVRAILADANTLLGWYRGAPLRSSIGSDSVGRSRSLFGMGLVVVDTLPARARREVRRAQQGYTMVPVRTEALLTTTWHPRTSHAPGLDAFWRVLRRVPLLRALGHWRREYYVVPPNVTRMDEQGNIATLGHVHPPAEALQEALTPARTRRLGWRYLNTDLRAVLKVLIGFVPAFLSFWLTKDWWVLALFGAPIWFGITGFRNIVQSVVGGGGIVRSHLLRWRDLVSWERVTDSLLFTGFSVPLLDWLVKGVVLDRGLDITTSTSPVLLYTLMALANGIYISSHNVFRGLPRAAAVGNFFRSVLSIPLAIALNAVILQVLLAGGMALVAANAMLQLWAAVIGKLASDTVAGVIEGAADRAVNVRVRHQDYQDKVAQILEIHGRLELLFPDDDVLEMLSSPKEFVRSLGKEAYLLERRLIINSLDLLYFWMYQPRARKTFRRLLAAMTPEERLIVLRSQRILERTRTVSEVFLDDLVGKNFRAAMAFYLERYPVYLRDLARLEAELEALPAPEPVPLAAAPPPAALSGA